VTTDVYGIRNLTVDRWCGCSFVQILARFFLYATLHFALKCPSPYSDVAFVRILAGLSLYV